MPLPLALDLNRIDFTKKKIVMIHDAINNETYLYLMPNDLYDNVFKDADVDHLTDAQKHALSRLPNLAESCQSVIMQKTCLNGRTW